MKRKRTAWTILSEGLGKKLLVAGITFLVIFFYHPSWTISSVETPYSGSKKASENKLNLITTKIISAQATPETLTIQKYLETKNSPLLSNSEDFVLAAKEFGVDPFLLPAIAGVESNFGQQLIAGSYNPFGWSNGTFYFKNYREAIYTVAKSLRVRYVKSGEITPSKIGRMYASSWPTWIPHVESVQNQIKNFSTD